LREVLDFRSKHFAPDGVFFDFFCWKSVAPNGALREVLEFRYKHFAPTELRFVVEFFYERFAPTELCCLAGKSSHIPSFAFWFEISYKRFATKGADL